MDRIFGLVDCNSFFCSCERLFRPDLRSRPVLVLSNNDGCVVARTNEVKALGIPMGVPFFKIRDLCLKERVVVFSSNFSLYNEISRRVMEKLSTFSPKLEYYSIDEAFFDLSGFNDLNSYALTIKSQIEKEIGIPVSVGVSKTKVLTKMANEISKKSGVPTLLLTQESIDLALKSFPVGDIWGIGPSSREKLKRIGVFTAADFLKLSDLEIRELLTKTGEIVKRELLGESLLPLNDEVVKKESIMSSRSFGEKVYDFAVIKKALAHHTSVAAEKLRDQKSYCHELSIFMRTNFFGDGPHYNGALSSRLTPPLFDTRALIKEALKMADQIYRYGFPYAKCGIILSRLSDERQLSLFDQENGSEKVMKVMDLINVREGPLFLRSAACGTDEKDWFMKQSSRSPAYLTDWRDLPRVI